MNSSTFSEKLHTQLKAPWKAALPVEIEDVGNRRSATFTLLDLQYPFLPLGHAGVVLDGPTQAKGIVRAKKVENMQVLGTLL